MFYSHSHQEKAFNFFASFVRNAISGDTRYQTLIQPIILDAQSLAKKEKNYYGISRSDYDIIVFLADKDPLFFKDLDVSHLSSEDYSRILKMITEQRDLHTA